MEEEKDSRESEGDPCCLSHYSQQKQNIVCCQIRISSCMTSSVAKTEHMRLNRAFRGGEQSSKCRHECTKASIDFLLYNASDNALRMIKDNKVTKVNMAKRERSEK